MHVEKRRKRLSLLLALALLLTSVPLPSRADESSSEASSAVEAGSQSAPEAGSGVNATPGKPEAGQTEGTTDAKRDLNKGEVTSYISSPADPTTKEAANAEVKDPPMPSLYTVQIDYRFKDPDGKTHPAWQTYRATVGEKDTDPAINKVVPYPNLTGYDGPQTATDTSDTITWQFVKENDDKTLERNYEGLPVQIKLVHKFQSLEQPNVFENRGEEKVTYQDGTVGTTMEIEPLKETDRPGFVPEQRTLKTEVPAAAGADYAIELHYLRDNYDVKYDSKGGSPVRAKRLYFEQVIPAVENPTMEGADFKGWSANCDLVKTDGTPLSAGSLISKDDFQNLRMPAQDVIFTAQWETHTTAEYVVLFWTEKSDYDDSNENLPLRDRYDYVGLKVVKDQPVGESANLSDMDPSGLKFPDIDKTVTSDADQLKKYYHKNIDLTNKANQGVATKPDNSTVYNLYYDRAVYELVFEKHGLSSGNSFDPIIKKGDATYDATRNPYSFKARYYQSLVGLWPKDIEITNWPNKKYGQGWKVNGDTNFLDTPHYRLTGPEFISKKGKQENFVSRPDITIDDNQISLGVYTGENCHPVHVDFAKEGFTKETFTIDYPMYYWKSDTAAPSYPFPGPILKGFTLINKTQRQYMVDRVTLENKNKARPDDYKLDLVKAFPQGNPKGKDFTRNGYLLFKYSRNSYELYLNNDPDTAKETGGFGEGDHFSVPYDKPLKDLNLDTTHVPEPPANVPADYEFKGWALDAAGAYLVKDGDETMPNYDKTLFAKWGPPEKYWKVTFDPNGGTVIFNPDAEAPDVMTGPSTKPVREETKLSKDRLKAKPTREGYDFMGWELVLYKKDENGKYILDQDDKMIEDTSYKDTYHVPPLYAFDNPVVEDIYLRANWVKSKTSSMTVHHVFYDLEGNQTAEETDNRTELRIGSEATATAKYQGDQWILRDDVENNGFFQTIVVDEDPAKNKITFAYRPWRHREYTVNYVDQAGQALLDPEKVTNLNRDYDARNYKPIPGYRLTSDPQQTLVFDLGEDGDFLGINGTKKKEITFTYQDVRILERKNGDAATPDGYHRVVFQKGDHGSLKLGEAEKDEVVYDVINGLHFDKLTVPEPQGLNGYTFTGWKVELPAKDTEVKQDYTFVAQWKKELDVSYEFQAPKDRTLPEAVTKQLPETKKYEVGEEATAPDAKGFTAVSIDEGEDQGTWTFTGWDKDSLIVTDGEGVENKFIGSWTFTPKAKGDVKYEFTYTGDAKRSEPSETAKQAMEDMRPANTTAFVGTSVPAPTSPDANATVREEEGIKGEWKFKSWTPAEAQTMTAKGITFTGEWTFTERAKVEVSYDFVFKDGDRKVDKPAVIAEEPPAAEQVYTGDSMPARPEYQSTYTETRDGVPGTWKFTGWTQDPNEAAGSHHWIGTWAFTPEDQVNVNYIFAFVDEAGDKLDQPEDFSAQLPEATQIYKTQSVAAPAKTSAPTNTYTDVETKRGHWAFQGWGPEKYENVQDDVTFTGTWKFILADKYKYPPQGGEIAKKFGVPTTAEEVLKQVTIPDYPKDMTPATMQVAENAKLPDGKTKGEFLVPVDVTYPDGSKAQVNVKVTVGPPLSEQYPPTAEMLEKAFGDKATKDEVIGKVTIPNYPEDLGKPTIEVVDPDALPNGMTPQITEEKVKVTYPDGSSVIITVPVKVKWPVINQAPSIQAEDKVIRLGSSFDPLKDVTATDPEDGDMTLTLANVIDNQVNPQKAGRYTVTYRVTDSQGATTTKTITVQVVPPEAPFPGHAGDTSDAPGQSGGSPYEPGQPGGSWGSPDQSTQGGESPAEPSGGHGPAGQEKPKLGGFLQIGRKGTPGTGDAGILPYGLVLVLAVVAVVVTRRLRKKEGPKS